jgi:transcriptional regulator with XRE-family HTH domain
VKRSVERAHRVEPRKATPVDEAIGRQIRKRRRMLGISQYQLAQAIGIASQQIQKYEIGANRLSASRLVAIAEALEVPIAWFFRNVQSAAQREALDPHKGRNVRPRTESSRKIK